MLFTTSIPSAGSPCSGNVAKHLASLLVQNLMRGGVSTLIRWAFPVCLASLPLQAQDGVELYFAQFGDGAGLFSQIILFNLDPDREVTVTMIFKDNDGSPLSVDLNGELVTGEKTIVIPAGGLRSFKTDGLGDLLDGTVTVVSDQEVAGVILFGGTSGLAGVGSSAAQPGGVTAPMETDSALGINTGIAVMNLEEDAVNLDLQLCDRDGAVLASAAAVLPGMGHVATFVSDFEWSTAVDFSDFEGTLKVTADGLIAATAMQTRPGQFATLPVVPINSTVQTLPIPPLYTGEMQGEARVYDLLMTNGSKEFIEGLQTPTSGYNGDYLGPTLWMRKGDQVVLHVTN